MPVASVHPADVAKAEKKGRTRSEVDQIFLWLTGHSQASLEDELAKQTSSPRARRWTRSCADRHVAAPESLQEAPAELRAALVTRCQGQQSKKCRQGSRVKPHDLPPAFASSRGTRNAFVEWVDPEHVAHGATLPFPRIACLRAVVESKRFIQKSRRRPALRGPVAVVGSGGIAVPSRSNYRLPLSSDGKGRNQRGDPLARRVVWRPISDYRSPTRCSRSSRRGPCDACANASAVTSGRREALTMRDGRQEWCARQDSNLRPSAPQADALSI
jgi:hypothetical protein